MTTTQPYPFQNPDLALEERVNDLVSRFTLDEKIKLMCQYQTEIPRLGVNKYKHGTEGAHGVAWLGEATVFPQNIGLACTWSVELMQQIGSVIGDEARIFYQRDPATNSLTVWAPTVDMERDPRWGRTEEAYGEDPKLTGDLSTALVKGMQGDHPFYYKTVATLKHFYGNNNEVNRGSASVSIDPRNKREYYLKAFEPAFVEGGAASMMTAYNGINGTPCNLNNEVNEIVKGEWGMNGFVVGDAGDVLGTVMDHHYVDSYAEAVARSIKAGIDSITDEQDISFLAIRNALEQGLLEESDLEHALRNTFRVRMRLGEFDPAERNPYSHVPESKRCAPEHAALSLQAARESIVLLKNDGLLPLNKHKQSVGVIGPLANEVFTDWYSGTPPYRISPLKGILEKVEEQSVHFHTGLDLIRLRSAETGKYVILASQAEGSLIVNGDDASSAETFERTDWGWGNVTLRTQSSRKFVTEGELGLQAIAEEARGWFVKESFQFDVLEDGSFTIKSWEGKSVVVNVEGDLVIGEDIAGNEDRFIVEVVEAGMDEAVKVAEQCDTAIVVVGNSPFINGKETIDRPDITLPASQETLIKAIYEANPNTVVVIVGSYPFAINWEKEHIPSIIYTSHSGQELGHALADVLYGDYNPAGRLNMTWYKSIEDLPDLMDYDIIKGKRTYQYFDGEVLYPFGHGLSYTQFEYSGLTTSNQSPTSKDTITITVNVRNSGEIAGDEVVQLYVRADNSRVTRPLKTLQGFRRLHLAAGTEQIVQLELKIADLAMWDVTRDRYCVESGPYTVMIGTSSSNIVDSTTLQVEGEVIPPRSLQQPVRAINYDDYEMIYIDECREGGESVRTCGGNGWILFKDVEFGEEATHLEARVSGHMMGGQLIVTVDRPEGTVASTCKVTPTGGRQAWTTITSEVCGLSGRHDVYITMKGEIQLSWLRIK